MDHFVSVSFLCKTNCIVINKVNPHPEATVSRYTGVMIFAWKWYDRGDKMVVVLQ